MVLVQEWHKLSTGVFLPVPPRRVVVSQISQTSRYFLFRTLCYAYQIGHPMT